MPKASTASVLRLIRRPGTASRTADGEMLRRIQDLSLEQRKLRRCIERADALLLEYERNAAPPSGYYLELLVPMGVTKDFLANLVQIYDENWVPKFGEKRARRLWHRQCIGLVVLHWFNVVTSAAERLRKVFYSWG